MKLGWRVRLLDANGDFDFENPSFFLMHHLQGLLVWAIV